MKKIYVVPTIVFELIENEGLLVTLSKVKVESGITEETNYNPDITVNQDEGDGSDVGSKKGFSGFFIWE